MADQSLRRWRWWRLGLILPALGLLLWYGSGAVGYVSHLRAYTIPSGSMAPAILSGDRITVDIRGGTPKRSEIWTFSSPTGTVIKRVIGLPGESIEVKGGQVWIDGKPLAEPYLNAPITYTMPPVSLGLDQYFMMGDSRNASNDGHIWGPLHQSKLIGRAEYRFWPQGRIGPMH